MKHVRRYGSSTLRIIPARLEQFPAALIRDGGQRFHLFLVERPRQVRTLRLEVRT